MEAFYIFSKQSLNQDKLGFPGNIYGRRIERTVEQEEAKELLGEYVIVPPGPELFEKGFRKVYAKMRGRYNPDASALCNEYLYGTVIFSK